MSISIRGGDVLIEDSLVQSDVVLGPGRNGQGIITALGPEPASQHSFDASGLLVLPGMVDIHGDAFERQIQPRPGVAFATDLALLETDRQLAANGITTAYHGLTWSWEPGLRGSEAARDLVDALERVRPRLAVDTRLHLRQETFNLEAEAEIIDWIKAGRISCLAFNDHMSGTIKERHRPEKLAKMIERSGLRPEAFQALVDRVWARREEVPASIARLAAAGIAAGVSLLSHDDTSPEMRAWFRSLGVSISEFPTTVAATEAAADAGEVTVFGAPNVVRGGSHTGCPTAAEMVARGLCSVLASDYYYPALLLAPFRLQAQGIATLEAAWPLVSANAARALGLTDRGSIGIGRRADVIAVDASDPALPVVVATFATGRPVYIADGLRWR